MICQTNTLILIISSIVVVGSVTILGCQGIEFMFDFYNRSYIDEVGLHDIYYIEELVDVGNNIIENDNLAYISLNTITNIIIGLYRVLNFLARFVYDDVNPRLNEAVERLDNMTIIIEQLTRQ